MIEKFSKEELDQILKEVNELALAEKPNHKRRIVLEESSDVLGSRPFICSGLKSPIYAIADFITNNYERREVKGSNITRSYVQVLVPKEKENDYRKIVRGIIEVLKPYYGMEGFRQHI